ncbi:MULTISPECIES: hypothetical protein [Sandaracinus]|uniref:hypothetical protein n=1 Tax=Sandaracinus TaxID=1055688 RepID=UPI0019D4CF6B|nr:MULTISPECIES: hypothetical protein [Sandaracinus]QRN75787.1 Hypothetical protein MSR10575_88740 [Sandaracinus sp.]UJR87304.1 Hypothetical protein I5071_960 [Sandaracinus amylolyticus]
MRGDYSELLEHGAIGRSAEVWPGHREQLIRLPGGDEAATRVVTVCLVGPELADPIATTIILPGTHVVAEVQWGVGPAVATAEVDFVRGAQFTVCASGLHVSARVDGPTDVPAPRYRVGAFAGYGAASSSSPRRTLYTSTEAAAGGAFQASIDLPPFAAYLRALRGPARRVPMAISFIDRALEELARIEVTADVEPPLVPVPNGAAQVTIATPEPAPCVCCFELAL